MKFMGATYRVQFKEGEKLFRTISPKRRAGHILCLAQPPLLHRHPSGEGIGAQGERLHTIGQQIQGWGYFLYIDENVRCGRGSRIRYSGRIMGIAEKVPPHAEEQAIHHHLCGWITGPLVCSKGRRHSSRPENGIPLVSHLLHRRSVLEDKVLGQVDRSQTFFPDQGFAWMKRF